jgi:hypothetical protein
MDVPDATANRSHGVRPLSEPYELSLFLLSIFWYYIAYVEPFAGRFIGAWAPQRLEQSLEQSKVAQPRHARRGRDWVSRDETLVGSFRIPT